MARLSTDQWLGTLLGEGPADEFAPARSGGMSDEELLATLAQQQPPEPPPAPPAPMPGPAAPLAAAQPVSYSVSQAASPAARSREEMLLSTLQRPSGRDLGMAAMFDSLVGGTRHSDDARARRNTFDQARIGAQAADVGSAERTAENEQSRGMQREQMDITRRGQDFADKRAEEQRALQQYLLEKRLGSASTEKAKDRTAAMDRAKLGPHHKGAGGPVAPQTPEQIEKEAQRLAAYLKQQVNVSKEVAEAYAAGNQEALAGVPKDKLDELWANATNFRSLDFAEQQRVVKARLSSEGNTPDSTAAAIEKKKMDPKERLKLKDEVSSVGNDIGLAKHAWEKMSTTAKQVFVKLAGAGGDIAQSIKSAALSPEDQKYSGQLQSLANALIKARSGSAVTGSEWNRVAQEIGWPTGDFSLFNTTAGIDGWLDKSKRAWVNRVKNIKSEYGDIWGTDGGQ